VYFPPAITCTLREHLASGNPLSRWEHHFCNSTAALFFPFSFQLFSISHATYLLGPYFVGTIFLLSPTLVLFPAFTSLRNSSINSFLFFIFTKISAPSLFLSQYFRTIIHLERPTRFPVRFL